MTIIEQIWHLDTCDCQIIISYDDTTPLDTRTYSLVNYQRTCAIHQDINDIPTRHATIVEENTRKNQAYQLIIDHAPASMLQTLPNGTTDLKKGIDISYTVQGIAPNRTFTLIVTGITLTTNQISTAQNFLDNRFGTGKVTMVNNP